MRCQFVTCLNIYIYRERDYFWKREHSPTKSWNSFGGTPCLVSEAGIQGAGGGCWYVNSPTEDHSFLLFFLWALFFYNPFQVKNKITNPKYSFRKQIAAVMVSVSEPPFTWNVFAFNNLLVSDNYGGKAFAW